jgi:hypothetical protein
MAAKAQWLGIGVMALVLGLMGGTVAATQMLKEPLQRLNLITPVFVLDRTRSIQAIPPNATPEQMARTVEDWQRLATKLSDAGYVVLDSTAVVAAPDDTYVRPGRTVKP